MSKKEKIPKQPKSFKRFMIKMFFKRLPIIILFGVVFMIGTMKVLERFPDSLKTGFAEFFTQSTPYTAEIESLERVNLFPSLYVGVKNMILYQGENVADIKMEMEKAKIHIPFIAKFTGERAVYDMGVVNMTAQPGVLTPHTLIVESLSFEKPSEANSKQGALVVKGSYSDKTLNFRADVTQKKTILGHVKYKFEDIMPYTLTIDDVTLSGDMVYLYDKMALQNTVLQVAGNDFDLKDSFIVNNTKVISDNPIQCLLEYDFKKPQTICMEYLKQE